MNGVHDPELAAHVVAWHNRHPLAVRISADQIRGLGTVRLPLEGLETPLPLAASLGPRPAAGPASAKGLRARAEGKDSSPQADVPSQADSPPVKLVRRSRFNATRARAQPAFSEPFIERLNFSAVAKFAERYGAEHDPFEGQAPVREVPASSEAVDKNTSIQVRYLKTVAIETDGQRVRLLLAASRWRRPAILGARVYSRTRMAWWGCALSVVAFAFTAGVLLPRSDNGSQSIGSDALAGLNSPTPQSRSIEATVPIPSSPDAWSAPSDSARTSVAALVPTPVTPSLATAVEPPNTAGVEQVPAHSARGTEAEGESPHSSESHAWPVDIRPKLTPEAARDARRLAAALRQTVPVLLEDPETQEASAMPPAAPPTDSRRSTAPTGFAAQAPLKLDPSQAVPVALTTAPASAPRRSEPMRPPQMDRMVRSPQAGEQSYALVARQTRSRAASELLLGLMRDSEIPAGWPATRTEVIPTPQGFRAGWFPFASREDAEAARERLSRSGLPTEVIEF